jgi:hypothetical protein
MRNWMHLTFIVPLLASQSRPLAIHHLYCISLTPSPPPPPLFTLEPKKHTRIRIHTHTYTHTHTATATHTATQTHNCLQTHTPVAAGLAIV